MIKAYVDELKPKEENGEEPEAPRRGPPAPFNSPPFPSERLPDGPSYRRAAYRRVPTHESDLRWSQWRLVEGKPHPDLRLGRCRRNWSSSTTNNLPNAFNIRANKVEMQQSVLRFERVPDTVQTDHMDWGFKFDNMYGIDYRYTTAKGILSGQLLNHDHLYGYDPVQFYGELYFPNVGEGTLLRVGRFILLPGIEADLAVDNYMFSHTILYTYFPYTHTGVLATTKLNDQWTIQYGLTAGSDVALWTDEREVTPIVGIRWVSKSNNDSIYACTISNSGMFSYNNVQMLPDVVWTHKFNDNVHMLTEAYYCYQWNVPDFTAFGANNQAINHNGYVRWYGVSNYFEIALSKKTYLTIRNEGVNDEEGQRTGFQTWYSTHTLGIVHKPTSWLILRPELKYSHSYNANAYNQPDSFLTGSRGPGTRNSQIELTLDAIFRF